MQPVHRQQHRIVRRRTARRVERVERVAQHFLDDLRAGERRHRPALNQPAVAQHRQGVADGLQLMNAVRDKHHAHALRLEASDHREQALAFVLIERRGGFIENQITAVMRERPRQQHMLFFGKRATVDTAIDVHIDIKLRQRRTCAAAGFTPAVAQPALAQAVEHNVFRDAQPRHQRGVHFLLHQMNAERLGVARGADVRGFAIQQDLALIVIPGTGEHRHQRRFSGAVRPGKRMHGPGAQGEIHLRQRREAAEGQGYRAHLKALVQGHSGTSPHE
ncbi:hypothetical protein BN132_1276 [Cronobacter turicensis 564]|nr:hypothetical protein BN132_1276 [Cronobacter turicensis 564]